MLTSAYHKAEKLAEENDLTGLETGRQACAKKQTRVAYVGLATMVYLFCGQWAAEKISPGIVSAHAEGFRIAYILIGLVGLGFYFSMSKRYSEKGQLFELALELKKRAAAAPKKE
jgi:hypothetical protein